MSYVEQSRDLTERERLAWVKIYQRARIDPPYSIRPEYAVDCRRECCDNCEYFDTFANFDLRDEGGLCLKNVANDEYGEYINDSDTFYCAYHKFKV